MRDTGNMPPNVARLAVLALSVLLAATRAHAEESRTNSYLIGVEAPSRPADLQVHSFITGAFGGLGANQVKLIDEDGVLVTTEYEGKPAKTLRAVLYLPGCQMQLIRVDDLQLNSRQTQFFCVPLETVKLEGKVDPSAFQPGEDPEIWIQYIAQWSHPFFGILDGIVMTLDAGTASLEPDGRFHIDLPGFALDPLSSDTANDAYFMLNIRSKKSGSLLAWLQIADPVWSVPSGDLAVERAYPAPLTFAPRPQH